MRAVTKGARAGLATITNRHPFGFLDFMRDRGLAGVEPIMRTVTVRLVGRFTAGTVVFVSRSFIDLCGLVVVGHVFYPY